MYEYGIISNLYPLNDTNVGYNDCIFEELIKPSNKTKYF